MSLSDYISIFDTRPIAQSHLSGAATATFCQHGRVCTRMNAYEREPKPWNTNTVYRCTALVGSARHGMAEHGMARHGTATPLRSTPRHARMLRTAHLSRRPPRGPCSISLSLSLDISLPLRTPMLTAVTTDAKRLGLPLFSRGHDFEGPRHPQSCRFAVPFSPHPAPTTKKTRFSLSFFLFI